MCQKTFGSQRSMRRHVTNVHRTNEAMAAALVENSEHVSRIAPSVTLPSNRPEVVAPLPPADNSDIPMATIVSQPSPPAMELPPDAIVLPAIELPPDAVVLPPVELPAVKVEGESVDSQPPIHGAIVFSGQSDPQSPDGEKSHSEDVEGTGVDFFELAAMIQQE